MIGPLQPIQPEHLDDVARFLRRVHNADPAVCLADTRMLEWKYLQPRSDWTGSRGFMLQKNGQIVACGGLVPAVFRVPGGRVVKSAALTDWAADRSMPGSGVILVRRLLDRVDTLFVVAGTVQAREVLPKIGFRPAGTAFGYARWVRPRKEFRVRPKTFRSLLRLSHGLLHSFGLMPRTAGNWDNLPIDHFDSSLQPILERRSSSLTFCDRTIDALNYMLQCPAVKMKTFLLRRKESLVGYFLLAITGWEGRIVDIFVDSDQSRDWKTAYALAIRAAASETNVCRIFAWGTSRFTEALVENRFWLQDKKPIVVCDPKNLLAGALPIEVQLFEGDNAYLID